MKKFVLTLFWAIVLTTFASAFAGQPMMISATGPMKIGPSNRVALAEGYCLNERLDYPSPNESYEHLSNPNAIKVVRTPADGGNAATLALAAAIKEGYLEVRGTDDLSLQFRSRDDATYEITVEKPLVMASTHADLTSVSDLAESEELIQQIESLFEKAAIKEADSPITRQENAKEYTQDLVWLATNRRADESIDLLRAALKETYGEETSEKAWGLAKQLQAQSTLNGAIEREISSIEIGSRAKVRNLLGQYNSPSLQSVRHIERVLQAPRLKLEMVDGNPKLRSNVNAEAFDVHAKAMSETLFSQANISAGNLLIIDVSEVRDNKALSLLCEEVKKFEKEWSAEVYFSTDEQSIERLALLHSPSAVSVVTDDSIRLIPNLRSEEAYQALFELETMTKDMAGPKVEVLAGHNDGKSVNQWIIDAKNKRFADKHIVVAACNVKPQLELFNFARVAMENGARSVVCADDAVSSRSFTLAASRIRNVALLGNTPIEFWRACHADAFDALSRCLDSDDPSAAVRDAFGKAGEVLFDTDGLFMENEAKKVLRAMMGYDPSIYHQFGACEVVSLFLAA